MGKDPPESESKAKGLISRLGRWTGFGDKTLWNILELLIVPAVLAIGAFYLEDQASNRQEQIANERYKQEQGIASSRYQQETLKAYFDQMTQLLLEKNLRKPGSEAQVIARARTLSTLGELDETRKGLLLKFLHEAKLISQNKQNKPVVSLIDANLSRANLQGANLSRAYLSRANLSRAYLSRANLQGANLSRANLSRANLSRARLHVADLTDADLKGADLSRAYLNYAQMTGADLKDANLSDAILTGADLKDANLSDAILTGADLTGADLTGADLTGAKNIEPDQVKAARFWKEAKYSPDFRKQLVQVGVNKQTIR